MSDEKIRFLLLTENLQPFELFTNDTRDLTVEFLNENDQPDDISPLDPALFRVTARQTEGDSILFTINGAFVTDGTDGKIKFTFTPTETANTLNEGLLEIADNNNSIKVTIFKKIFNIFKSIQ